MEFFSLLKEILLNLIFVVSATRKEIKFGKKFQILSMSYLFSHPQGRTEAKARGRAAKTRSCS